MGSSRRKPPKFRCRAITLSVGGKAVTAEVADEPQERVTGLMFRKNLAPDSGMLFVMPEPERRRFLDEEYDAPALGRVHQSVGYDP